MAVEGEGFARLLNNPGRLTTYPEAVGQVEQVIQLAACWERFPVKKILLPSRQVKFLSSPTES